MTDLPIRRRKVNRDAVLMEVAKLMLQTYGIERSHYTDEVSPDNDTAIDAFAHDFGELQSVKRHRNIHNIEDQPRDPAYMSTAEKYRYTPRSQEEIQRSKRETLWLKIANFVVDQQYDPENYIRAQFAMFEPMNTRKLAIPFPESFLSSNARQLYDKWQQNRFIEVRTELTTQINTFNVECSGVAANTFLKKKGDHAWAYVLRDNSLNMSALFRYCMARNILNDDQNKIRRISSRNEFIRISNMYRTAAAVQYARSAQAYDEGWKIFLPTGWPDKAQGIYRSCYGVTAEKE